ncbi:MAG: hypothetical protein Roseis2KO_52890 [Roseivirga sp.]
MEAALEPENERERLEALESYSILDTLPEEDFDSLTAIASQICGTHISLVSLIDQKRQWFKSHHGLDVDETPKEYAFCAHAINKPDEIFVVEDAREDERFHDNPLVTDAPHVIFYAGVPLINEDGLPLGTLCVIDKEPKVLSQAQINSLQALSRQVMNVIELRRKKSHLEEVIKILEERNDELDQFAYMAAHDLKSPLATISGMSNFLISNLADKLDLKSRGHLEMISKSADRLRNLMDGLLRYNTCMRSVYNEKTELSISSLSKNMGVELNLPDHCKIEWKSDLFAIIVNESALSDILKELISNAIRYNDKDTTHISVEITETEKAYHFHVIDNGPGIAPTDHASIFRVFEVATVPDRFGIIGSGIGLATARKIVESQHGNITLSSEPGKGADFIFSLKK